MQCAYQLVPSMDTYRARKAKPPDHEQEDADDSDELGVFAAERYFYGDDDALWPWERSSSSLSSAFRTTGTHEHDRSVPTPTAVTSSSEASWNSRSALLPNEPAEKLHDAVAAATPIIEAGASGAEGQRARRRPASSSNMRRWLLGVAACACAAGGASEESMSADEMETSERFPETENPEATAARSSVTPASGRWLVEGDKTTIAGMDGHRRATHLGELSTPVLHPQAAATSDSDSDSDERRRIKSLEMFRPVPVGDRGSALGSATQSSALTIVAGNRVLGVEAPLAAGGGGSPGEDDAALSELGCAYPPSEASVVWSVVTADGAASGNFSSAASGYYYHYCFNDLDNGAMRRAAARNTHKRRSGIAGGSSLLMCMNEKAVDAVGPARSVHRQEVQPAAMATLGASAGRRNGHGGACKPSRT